MALPGRPAAGSKGADVDFRQLEMFGAVAEEGTFTKAAERLHVSQSAISRQVKLLEEELGGSLLHRGPKKVTLTQPGELLLKMVNRVQRDMQDVVAQISDTHTLNRGSLSVAGGMTVCLYIFPRLLKKFRSLYPLIDLRVASGASENIQRQLRSTELDLALLTLPILARDLEVLPVLKEEMVVVTAPGHPLSRERTVEPLSLAKYPLILYETGSNSRKVLDQFFLEAQIPVEVAMETENVEIIKAMVGNGLGVSIIPFAAVAKDVRTKRLAYARVRGRKLYRETGWVYLKSEYVPRTITEMIRVFDQMKDLFGGRPPVT
jgi:DNA-binding transcriptional LysR family regulator